MNVHADNFIQVGRTVGMAADEVVRVPDLYTKMQMKERP